MKKLSLLFAAICCVMALSAKTLYFEAGSWNTNGNKFAIWSWTGSEAGSWSEFMTSVEDGVFKADIDDSKSSCIFVSFKSDAAAPDWSAKIKQTSDLTIPASLNFYKLATNSWSTYGSEVAVTGVSFSVETLKIRPAQTYTLEAIVFPEGASNSAVTWESSNPTVATIDNGVLSTLTVGTTNITVTTVDGGKTATCAVTVSEDDDAVKGITIHVTVPTSWTKVCGYTFMPEYLGSWPGTELTTKDSAGRYVITFNATIKSVNLIINNGNGGTGKQTQDLKDITADACYTIGDDGQATAIDCGTGEKPEPTPKDYYLIGYINGADYGKNDDYANLGEYKFTGDPLQVTATFTETSYVFVKTGDNAHWYLAAEYVDATVESVPAILAEGNSADMGVPGNVELTFTLLENEDGTLTLSYTTGTTGLENTTIDTTKARKIVENGQIYILRDGVRYNIFGAQVQ